MPVAARESSVYVGVTLAENVSRFQKSQADQRVATIRRKQKLEAALDLMEQDET